MAYNKETQKYEGYIYLITNKVNNKKYVGQTIRTIEARYKNHLEKVKNNRDNQLLYTAMKKYGTENFYVKEIEKISCKTKELLIDSLNKKEIYYISKYNTKKPNGYNMTDGGVLLPNTYDVKPVCNYDLERNLVKEFESVAEAARYYNISQADISHCCKREKVKMVNNFIWRFKGDDYDVKTIKLCTRIICQYDFNGNLLAKYNGEKEAISVTGIRNISSCCTGRCKQSGGYIWRFSGDAFDKYELPKTQSQMLYVYSLNMDCVKVYQSITDAAKDTGLKYNKIFQACHNNRFLNGYFWSLDKNLDVKSIKYIKYYKDKDKKIYMFDLYGNLLDTFENINSIPDKYNFTKTNVIDICRGKYFCYKNMYIFSFNSDFSDKYININKYDSQGSYIKTYKTIGDLLEDKYDYVSIFKACKKGQIMYNHFWKSTNN